MPLYPWRFQADVTKGDADPKVTVFIGPERQVLDTNGDLTAATFVEQNTSEPLVLPLSELPALLTGGAVTRTAPAKESKKKS